VETVTETLENILNDLGFGGDIEASVLISRDGLLMASGKTNGFNPEVFAAFSASIQNVAESSSSKLNRGVVNRTIVETKENKIITEGVDSNSLLVVVAKNRAKLGLILFRLSKAASKIKEAL